MECKDADVTYLIHCFPDIHAQGGLDTTVRSYVSLRRCMIWGISIIVSNYVPSRLSHLFLMSLEGNKNFAVPER
jgi:hypothetical protein